MTIRVCEAMNAPPQNSRAGTSRPAGDDICTSRLDAVRENLAAVIGALEHAMHMIAAEGHDETRK